jgi:hypothetical protein
MFTQNLKNVIAPKLSQNFFQCFYRTPPCGCGYAAIATAASAKTFISMFLVFTLKWSPQIFSIFLY